MSVIRVLALTALLATPAQAQSAFVHTLRGDTVQIEVFTRLPRRLDGEVSAKGAPRQVFSNRIEADGRLGTLSMAVFAPGAKPGATPVAQADIAITGDTAVAGIGAPGRATNTQRIQSRQLAQPIVNASVAAFEVIIAAARRDRTRDVPQVFLATGGQTFPVEFTNLQSDSIAVALGTQRMYFITDSSGRLVRGGMPQHGLQFTRVDGIAVSKLGLSRPDYSAPADAPYVAQGVTVPTGRGFTLGGTLTLPAGTASALPVVVSITGSGPQDRDEHIGAVPGGYRLFRQLADTLGRRGVAMLRLDDRGVGESGGDFAAATSRDFADDVRSALAFLRTQPGIDPQRVYLLGHSEGGMIAPMVALEEPSLAGLVILAGPARTGRQILDVQNRYALERDTTLSAAARAAALARVPTLVDSALRTTPWLRFFGSHDPLATARRVRQPVLILHGADDQQVPASDGATLAQAMKAGGNTDVTLRTFPDLNHLFIRQPGGDPGGYMALPTHLAAAEVLGAAVEWIVAHARH
ncbi:MAG: alpha/beta fold hydrolase [Gemmatimonadaceae bacterium]|nr:alpha/beta fold hydrolase [Gemmatimonadaceae bacterium]